MVTHTVKIHGGGGLVLYVDDPKKSLIFLDRNRKEIDGWFARVQGQGCDTCIKITIHTQKERGDNGMFITIFPKVLQ